MTTQTLPTNLNCGNCVAKVTPFLNAEPAIASWSVDTTRPDKPLTVTGDVSATRIAELVSQAGFKVLALPETPAPAQEVPAANPHVHISPAAPTQAVVPARAWFTTYKPILLVAGFLVAAVLVREFIAQRWAWMPMMDNFMGGFFLVFGFFKLLDVKGFAMSYRSYDIPTRAWPTWGYIYPFVEIALAVLYFTGAWPIATNAITFLLMTVGLAGVWQAVSAKRTIQCACLGTVFNLPMSTVTIIEDGLMAAMAAGMLVHFLV